MQEKRARGRKGEEKQEEKKEARGTDMKRAYQCCVVTGFSLLSEMRELKNREERKKEGKRDALKETQVLRAPLTNEGEHDRERQRKRGAHHFKSS